MKVYGFLVTLVSPFTFLAKNFNFKDSDSKTVEI